MRRVAARPPRVNDINAPSLTRGLHDLRRSNGRVMCRNGTGSKPNSRYEVAQSFGFRLEEQLVGIALLGDHAVLEIGDAVGGLRRTPCRVSPGCRRCLPPLSVS